MSFTTEVYEELLSLPVQRTCCRKALLLGLFYQAKREGNGVVSTDFRAEGIARLAVDLLKRQFSTESTVEERGAAGRKLWRVCARSKAVDTFLEYLDSWDDRPFFEWVGFRCADCSGSFLRGIFFATATLNDPWKGYHGEFLIQSEQRAERLRTFLIEAVKLPGWMGRRRGIGLYYKSNGCLADLLYLIGASDASFRLANICIERDIRNQENRATNCVTSNISRLVGASQKHLSAIAYLIEHHRLDSLPEELRQTAKLRQENPSASLTELGTLHNPQITKSGLNRRLTCILDAAREAGWSGTAES